MPLSVPEERRLAEIERELADDSTLVTLAASLGQVPQDRRRSSVPAPRLGWTLAALLSAIGVIVLIGGIAAGTPAGVIIAILLALVFQAPLILLGVLTRKRRATG